MAALATCFAPSVLAGGMDPTPERLIVQPSGLPAGQTCRSIAYSPELAVQAGGLPNDFPCRADNAAFRNLVAELGFAAAPTAFHPARTTGFGGFAFTLESSFTKINPDALSTASDGSQTPYWKLGTRGDVDATKDQYSIINNKPSSVLAIHSLKARKGLPLGFELATSMGWMADTSLFLLGADLRWSLLEGFRTGPLGYLPDLSIGGGVRTLAGSPNMYLTTVGIDVQLSKQFAVADSAKLTPYVGYQRLIIFGNSTILDFTPNVDAQAQCGYQGPDAETGAPRCSKRLSNGAEANADFNNNSTFAPVRIHRHRGLAGLSYRYEIFHVAGQFAFDLTDPGTENSGIVGARQWTTSLEAGVFF
jgi:hypothetical protein